MEKEDAPAAAAAASTAPAVDATASGDASGTNAKDEDGDVVMGEESSNAAGGGENVSAASHEKAKEETAVSNNNISSNTTDTPKDDNPPKSESKEKGESSSGEKETAPESTNGTAGAAPKVEKEEEASEKTKASSTEENKNADGAAPKVEKEEETSEKTKASSIEENKNADGAAPKVEKEEETSEKTKASSTEENKNAAASAPPPPVMKGTLSIDLVPQRRHLIRGMWNYENSNTFPPQRFELVRNLGPDEDEKKLPVDGEFHGSFSLAYVHTTSKGKQKERSKVIPETGVNIKFTKVEGDSGEYKVDGKGTNQFGVFHINGTATPSSDPADSTMSIVLRKRYEPGPVVAADNNDTSKSKSAGAAHAPEASSFVAGPLPEPAQSFPSGVVALRGNLFKEESNDLASGLGSTEVVHRITGMWASGLDLVLADPQNVRGICNRFEYEHKSTGNSQQFPVSGRYSGWFDLSGEDGSRTRINERDVMLKFRKNNADYHNIEGRGSNVFGKYTITGTLTKDNVITIFRHFQPRKLKKSAAAASVDQVPSAAPPAGGDGAAATARRPSSAGPIDPKLKLDDVKIPGSGVDGLGEGPLEPIIPPQSGTYSAVSRGVLRINEDGSHSCQGKWSVTREHFTNGATSNFNFRLEPHFAKEAAEAMKDQNIKFPLDSAMYKGTFQLKKQGTRYQTIVDQQIVMKFRKNKSGAYNVHGTGVNAIGEFNLLGTLVTTGKGTGGQVELYRTYPPDKLTVPQAPTPATQKTTAPTALASSLGASAASLPPPSSRPSMQQRRESSRSIKLPSRLEEDDPDAQLSRTLDKCSQILKFIREKDVELGAFFSEPVDPVALGIPTYFQIVKEPMDLRTIHRRMEANQIPTPEEFARLVRLVFENAMRFNLDPAHSVHQAARSLLTMFNQKFRDVDRTVQSIRRTHGIDVEGDGKKKGKDGKKKKEIKSVRQTRLDEADAMNAANASAIAAIVASAPATQSTTVSRTEFNMLLHVIQQLQSQVVQTHKLLADLSPGDPSDAKATSATASSGATSHALPKSTAPAPAPEKKKPAKRKSESISKVTESVAVLDDSAPLSLEEQELLTDTINELPEEHLGAVIQIIREAAPVGADEDEIDLEIDQLDTRTQRKLLRHIQKVRNLVAPLCLLVFAAAAVN